MNQVFTALLCNFRKCELKSTQKLQLCVMKFCVETWQKMPTNRNCTKCFHLLEQFAKLKKTQCMYLLISENTIQKLTSATCGQFQLNFYKKI